MAQATATFPLVFWLLILAGLCVLAIYILIQYTREERYKRQTVARSINMVLLKILVPHEVGDKAEKKSYFNQAAQLYASLYSIKDAVMHRSEWYPKGPHLSFEIVSEDNDIFFYVGVPRELLTQVEKQIFALYPDATIEESDRINIFHETHASAATELNLAKPASLPLKTGKELDNDPLGSILSAMTRLGSKEAAGLQILIRPTDSTWHKTAEYHIRQLQEGKKISTPDSGGTTILKAIGGFAGEILRSAIGNEVITDKKEDSKISPLAEQQIKAISEKAQLVGFETVIRLVVTAPDVAAAKMQLSNIVASFGAVSHPNGNSLTHAKNLRTDQVVNDYIFRAFPYENKNILNTEELASLFHPPHPALDIPAIAWLMSKRAAAPSGMPTSGAYIGTNIFRGARTPIYLLEEDRRRHMYVIGKTGTGKSIFLEDLCVQDIQAGHGVCFIDPHGESIDRILPQIPRERAQDVILFDVGDTKRPLGLNLLEYTKPEEKSLLVSELLNIFDKLYDLRQTGGPIFEQFFRNAALLVMEDPASGSTLLEIQRVMSDPDFRHYKLSRCQNEQVKNFWLKEAEKTSGEQSLENFVPYINSKMTPFLSNDLIRPIVAQQQSSFNLRQVMDKQKILLVKLSKGVIGETEAKLLGMVLVAKLYQATMSRADMPEHERRTFYLYLDEFQNFTTKSIANILAESRKYGLAMTVAHQYITQLTESKEANIRDAIFGNAGTAVAFRVGSEDAEQLVKQYFEPVFSAQDLTNIEKYNAYIKPLVNNTGMRAFSLNLYKDLGTVTRNHETAQIIRELSRMRYGRERSEIEQEIRERSLL